MITMLSEDDAEYFVAWKMLPSYDGIDKCNCCGECWQYLDTEYSNGAWWHIFRHRHFRGERVVLRVHASFGWKPSVLKFYGKEVKYEETDFNKCFSGCLCP